MGAISIRIWLGGMLACSSLAVAQAQVASPVDIPLQLLYVPTPSSGPPFPPQWRLGINVGINGGQSHIYLFDTGSSLFNAQYNQSWWPGFTPSSDPTTGYTPLSTVTGGSGIQYCYGNGLTGCRGYKGNIVQAGTLDLYTPTTSPGGQTLVTSLNAAPGYQINAVYESSFDGTSTLVAGTTAPVLENQFYGVFGAGDFTTPLHTYTTSGVLGQTTVTGAIQGYMVAANGQTNPVPSSGNQPTQINGQNVLLGGVRQAVTSCSPCVKLGLTPEVIGQFAPVGLPGATGGTGLIRWAETGAAFINPYGGATGNNASTQFGINFNVTLTAGGTTVTSTSGGLLDTGTGGLTLSTVLKNQPGISTNTSVLGGVTFTATGLAPDGSSISGLSSSSSVLQAQGSDPITYVALFDQNAPGLTNTIGLSFFLQNSVLYDLSDNVIAYTPYFVTDANLVTTAGGPLIVDSSNVPLGLAGVISGPGGVQIGNGGDVQLSATNTYTGATQIASGGRLLVSGPGSIAASSGVTNDGTFDISRAWAPISIAALTGAGTTYLGANTLVLTNASGTFSGSIVDGGSYPVGGGSLTIAGGTQGLSGANSYSGATTVQAGAQLNLLGTGNIVSSSGLANNGTFDISGVTPTGAGLQALTGSGQVNLGAKTLVLLNANGTFSGVMADGGASGGTGGGLMLMGGSQTLSGTNTYSGQTTVAGGLLTLTGSVAGDASVGSAGMLAGTGTIAGNLANAGMVAPGNPTSTLTIGGNYTQATGGTLYTQVNAAGQASQLAVGGRASLQGGTVLAGVGPGTYGARTTYTIVRATGGVTGAYASAASTAPFLVPSLSYDANDVYLTLQAGNFNSAAQTPTQMAVANALNVGATTASGDFSTVLGTLATLNPAQMPAVLNALSGQNYAAFSTSMTQAAQMFMNSFLSQAGGGSRSNGGGSRVALAEACDVESACDTTAPARWGAWGGGVGGVGSVGAGTGTGAVTYNLGGFAAGLDRRITETVLAGVAVGYTSGQQWVSGFSGSGLSNSYQVSLYGSYSDGPVYADGLAGYAYSNNQMWRTIAIPGLATRTAQASTGANQVFGLVEGGYRFAFGSSGDTTLAPFARLQGSTVTQNGFTETGAQSLDLTVAPQTTNSLRSVLGAQLAGTAQLGWGEPLALQVKLGWSHEYASTSLPVSATLAGAPSTSFTTYGLSPQRDGLLVGMGASTAIARATSLYARYEGLLSGSDSSHAFTAGVRMTW